MKTERQKSKKREKNALKWEKGNEALETFMYENGLENNTTQHSPYHFRIKTNRITIDIWAGVKKYYIHGTGGSMKYDDINELKELL